MAITSDGTQSFGIQDSPVTINSITYVVEGATFTQGGNRVDINDSNGEPLGSTLVPNRVEGSATLQYAAGTTANPSLGHEMVLSSTNGRNNTTYVITEVGDSQSQGDYAKCSISFYKKLN
ncbi:MAG: hypothetical protein CMI54_08995 [Parcubacteria group bacterium]|jgi:hypothetical protein|nr:hypothetical protein [Parcubacteria group bacterium]|tara:strand:- start:10960 stop:11319 length:360 start_codon:yes stop_codon:yes gene_type:complete